MMQLWLLLCLASIISSVNMIRTAMRSLSCRSLHVPRGLPPWAASMALCAAGGGPEAAALATMALEVATVLVNPDCCLNPQAPASTRATTDCPPLSEVCLPPALVQPLLCELNDHNHHTAQTSISLPTVACWLCSAKALFASHDGESSGIHPGRGADGHPAGSAAALGHECAAGAANGLSAGLTCQGTHRPAAGRGSVAAQGWRRLWCRCRCQGCSAVGGFAPVAAE